MNIQTILNQFHSIVSEINNQFKRDYTVPLFDPQAIQYLKDSAKNCFQDKQQITHCTLSPLTINIPEAPRNCYNPQSTTKISVTLEVSVTYTKPDRNRIIDPISSLNFVISLQSAAPRAFQSWHLDKQGDAHSDDNIHPEYHITLGGTKIKEYTQIHNGNLGEALYFGTPRYMHPPMDIILGIDFILNHYVKRAHAQYFLENDVYNKLVDQMKEILWKPYILALANNFCAHSIQLDNNILDIDETFSKAIIGKR